MTASGHSVSGSVDMVGAQIMLRRVVPNPLEARECRLTVFVNEGKLTRRQLAVALCLVLEDATNDDNVRVRELPKGVFEIVVSSCSDSLFRAITSISIQNLWKSKLTQMLPASFVVISSSHVQPDSINHRDVHSV